MPQGALCAGPACGSGVTPSMRQPQGGVPSYTGRESGFTTEEAGTRSGPALAPDSACKGGVRELCGGTEQRRRMERVTAMAHNVKLCAICPKIGWEIMLKD
jgi:hypothetical protein